MITSNSFVVNGQRQKLHTYHTPNSTQVSFVTYIDGTHIVARSERNQAIFWKYRGIAIDAKTFELLVTDGVTIFEVFDRSSSTTYTATLDQLRTRGRYQNTPFGLQLVMNVRYWSTDGVQVPTEPQQTEPTDTQLNLFEVSA